MHRRNYMQDMNLLLANTPFALINSAPYGSFVTFASFVVKSFSVVLLAKLFIYTAFLV